MVQRLIDYPHNRHIFAISKIEGTIPSKYLADLLRVAPTTNKPIRTASLLEDLLPTSLCCFLSADLVFCNILMTFLAPSLTADSMCKWCLNSSNLRSILLLLPYKHTHRHSMRIWCNWMLDKKNFVKSLYTFLCINDSTNETLYHIQFKYSNCFG